MKKELRFTIYNYECPDCGHKIWRDFLIKNPCCLDCGSTNPPIVTEDVLVKYMEILDTFTSEQFEEAKRITLEICEGKPLEEIEGLEVFDMDDETMLTEPMGRYTMLSKAVSFFTSIRSCSGWSDIFRTCFLGPLSSHPVVMATEELNIDYY
jgi:hypothetical protein